MKMMFRVLLFVFMQFGLLLSMVDAATDDDEPQEFVIAISDAAIELHPHLSFTVTEAQLFTAIYEGLLSYNPLTLSPEAAVAKRWEISDDGLVYTFHLREDAAYWNGDAVTAGHFRDAWIALLAPQANSYFSVLFDVIAGASDYRNGVHDDPAQVGVVVIDERTLEITLSSPTPFFLSTLCHYSFSPVHPRMLRVKDWNRFPLLLTNGPYVLKEMSDEEMILVQSKNYWDYSSDNFAQIRYLRVADEQDVLDEFVTRKVDWIVSGFGEDIARYNRALKVNAILGTSFYFVVADQPPWSDPMLRRALALAIPWEEVRNAEHYNFPTAALVPPLPDYEQQPGIAAQDIEEAMRLFAESDYSTQNGGATALPPLTIAVPDNNEDRRIAGLMADAWEGILNIEVTQEFISGYEYFNYVETARDYTVGRISWIGDYLDPLAFLQLWSGDSNLNHARYRGTEYDALLEQAAEKEGAERLQLLQKAENIILDSGLILPINNSVALNVIDTEQVRGWYVNILDIHPVKAIKKQRVFFLPDVALLMIR